MRREKGLEPQWIKDNQGKLLKEKNELEERWRNFFEELSRANSQTDRIEGMQSRKQQRKDMPQAKKEITEEELAKR